MDDQPITIMPDQGRWQAIARGIAAWIAACENGQYVVPLTFDSQEQPLCLDWWHATAPHMRAGVAVHERHSHRLLFLFSPLDNDQFDIVVAHVGPWRLSMPEKAWTGNPSQVGTMARQELPPTTPWNGETI